MSKRESSLSDKRTLPTPRTDAFIHEQNGRISIWDALIRIQEHARQLERELAEAQAVSCHDVIGCAQGQPCLRASHSAALSSDPIVQGGVDFIMGPGGDEGTRAGRHPDSPYAPSSHERSNDPNLLADLSVALDDWLHQYAPEHCDDDQVRNRAKRIFEMGGTLYYLAGLQKRLRAAIASASATRGNDEKG